MVNFFKKIKSVVKDFIGFYTKDIFSDGLPDTRDSDRRLAADFKPDVYKAYLELEKECKSNNLSVWYTADLAGICMNWSPGKKNYSVAKEATLVETIVQNLAERHGMAYRLSEPLLQAGGVLVRYASLKKGE